MVPPPPQENTKQVGRFEVRYVLLSHDSARPHGIERGQGSVNQSIMARFYIYCLISKARQFGIICWQQQRSLLQRLVTKIESALACVRGIWLAWYQGMCCYDIHCTDHKFDVAALQSRYFSLISSSSNTFWRCFPSEMVADDTLQSHETVISKIT